MIRSEIKIFVRVGGYFWIGVNGGYALELAVDIVDALILRMRFAGIVFLRSVELYRSRSHETVHFGVWHLGLELVEGGSVDIHLLVDVCILLHKTVVKKDYILVGIYGFLSGFINFGGIYRLSGLGALCGFGGCRGLLACCFSIAFVLM